jgi:hypothetical protein
MSLTRGRGYQRVSNCGRARKWESPRKPHRKEGDGGEAASIIAVLLSKDRTRHRKVTEDGGEYRTGEETCHFIMLCGQCETVIGRHVRRETSSEK